MARADDEKDVNVVSDESEESESSAPAEDPVLEGVPLASSAAVSGPRPRPDVRFCRRCKTNSYLRKGGCSDPG